LDSSYLALLGSWYRVRYIFSLSNQRALLLRVASQIRFIFPPGPDALGVLCKGEVSFAGCELKSESRGCEVSELRG